MTDDSLDEPLRQAEARVGQTLKGKWTLDRLLGVGGMACVYAATHRNQKRVAIKMLHPELSFNANVRQRFLREGYVANTVQHPGAVSVYDDDVGDDGCAFLVMELLDGETLEARWERKGKRLPPGEVLAFMDRVLDTLAAAHAQGIVHRDLKPENLFLTRDAQVKVLDFGIARLRELSSASKTQTGSLMGTPTFMPPEQARGRWEEVDAQSDLWAIGATMFTLLTGRFVHNAGTVNEALVLAVTQPAISLGVIRPELPTAMLDFVDRALAYDKQARWPDAITMQAALREAYLALAFECDEKTVVHQAAASLPESPAMISHVAGSTELASAGTAHPGVTAPRHRLLLMATGAVLVGVVLLTTLLSTGEKSAPVVRGTGHAAGAVIAPTNVATQGAVSIAPTPPALAIDDLPPEPARHRSPSGSPVRVAASAMPPARVMAPSTAAPQAPKPRSTDPFAGRE